MKSNATPQDRTTMTFHNIFREKIGRIIVDNREKNSLVPSLLSKKGYEIIWQQLPIGDYITSDLIIERKTISDLKNSIINKRMFRQQESLREHKNTLLIIEGNLDSLFDGKILHANSARGFLLSLALKEKTPFTITRNEDDTSACIDLLSRKKSNQPQSTRYTKPNMNEKERVEFILEGFEGIGPIKARKLINQFKSLDRILLAEQEELEKIIGKPAILLKKILTLQL